MTDYKKQGKRNKINGAIFERRVRADLESKGWIVSKWQNNVELPKGISNQLIEARNYAKCVQAKPGRFRMMQTGFPDFIAFELQVELDLFEIIFIECKTNGRLDKIEKEKAKWYLDNHYCSKLYIASKVKEKNRIKIKYEEFK